jgi:hypothetical protein
MVIAIRIFLSLPVTVAEAERSFSKLGLIKTYLRSNISQERLNACAILSVERETVEICSSQNVIEKLVDSSVSK